MAFPLLRVLSPTRLWQHSGLHELAHGSYCTEKGLLHWGREDGFQRSDFCGSTMEKGRKTFLFVSFGVNKWEKPGRDGRDSEAGKCARLKNISGWRLHEEESRVSPPSSGHLTRWPCRLGEIAKTVRWKMSAPLQQVRYLQITVKYADVYCKLISIKLFQ